MHGIFLSFPRRGDSVVFAGLEQAQNLAGKDIRRPFQIRFRDAEFAENLANLSNQFAASADRRLEFKKRCQFLIGAHNVGLSVAAVRASNERSVNRL